jgi:hypothetical protein
MTVSAPLLATSATGTYPTGIAFVVRAASPGTGSPAIAVDITMDAGFDAALAGVLAPADSDIGFLEVPSAGSRTSAWASGPTVTVDQHAAVFEVRAAARDAVGRLARNLGMQPFPTWWIIEGVDNSASVAVPETAITAADIASYLAARPSLATASAGDVRAEVLAGTYFLGRRTVGTPVSALAENVFTPFITTLRLRAFVGNGSTGTYSEVNPAEWLAVLGLLDATLAAHPLVVAAALYLASSDVTINISFSAWVPVPYGSRTSSSDPKGALEAPEGAIVTLVNGDDGTVIVARDALGAPIGPIVGEVGVDGTVTFTNTGTKSLPQSWFSGVGSFFFRIQLATSSVVILKQYAPPHYPESAEANRFSGTWETDGWLAADGLTDGRIVGFDAAPRTSVGSASNPVTYLVGVPIRVRIQHEIMDGQTAEPVDLASHLAFEGNLIGVRGAPKGVCVEVFPRLAVNPAVDTPVSEFWTDDDGEVWGTCFDLLPGDPVSVWIRFELFDERIGLAGITGGVFSNIADAENAAAQPRVRVATSLAAQAFSGPALGDDAADTAKTLLQRAQTEDKYDYNPEWYGAGLLFLLRALRDAHQFFHHLTEPVAAFPGLASWESLLGGVAELRICIVDDPEDTSAPAAQTVVVADGRFRLAFRRALEGVWRRDIAGHEFAHAAILAAMGFSRANYLTLLDWSNVYTDQTGTRMTAGGAFVRADEHSPRRIISPATAFSEGMAELGAMAVGGSPDRSWDVESAPDTLTGTDPDTGLTYPLTRARLADAHDVWGIGSFNSVGERAPLIKERHASDEFTATVLDNDAEGPITEALWRFFLNPPSGTTFLEPPLNDPSPSVVSFAPITGSEASAYAADVYPYLDNSTPGSDTARLMFQAVVWAPLAGLSSDTYWVDASGARVDVPQFASLMRYAETNTLAALDNATYERLRKWLAWWWVWQLAARPP